MNTSKISDPGFVHSEVTGVNTAKFLHVEDPNYVEPETVTTTASTFPLSSSCTLCGFTGSPKEFEDHNCFVNPNDPPEPNRFDPFEALDGILRAITEYGANSKAQERAEDHLYALRAYITGITT